MALFQRAGKDWRQELPPLDAIRGKPRKTSDRTLALLLAEYQARRHGPGSETRDQFLENQVGVQHFEAYSIAAWSTVEAVEWHLKEAEKRAKRDTDFAALVERLRVYFVATAELRKQIKSATDLAALGELLSKAPPPPE